MKIALVTGATSGMGREFARRIGGGRSSLDELWVIGRSKEKLACLQAVSGKPLRPLSLDLEREEDLETLGRLLKRERPDIRLLVNCAGMGRIGTVSGLSQREQCSCVRVNCEALTAVTCLCLPYIGRGARIIQMASAAAFVPQPGFAVYAASKAYVLSLSRALGVELRREGITVTAVCPGAVDTPFFDHQAYPVPEYKKRFMASPEAVVEKALRDAARGKQLSVCGGSMKALRLACRLLPTGMLMRIAYCGFLRSQKWKTAAKK